MWGVVADGKIVALRGTPAGAFFTLKSEYDDGEIFEVDVLDNGEIIRRRGPVQIIRPDGRLFSDCAHPLLTVVGGLILILLSMSASITGLLFSNIGLLLSAPILLMIVYLLNRLDNAAMEKAVEDSNKFLDELAALSGVEVRNFEKK